MYIRLVTQTLYNWTFIRKQQSRPSYCWCCIPEWASGSPLTWPFTFWPILIPMSQIWLWVRFNHFWLRCTICLCCTPWEWTLTSLSFTNHMYHSNNQLKQCYYVIFSFFYIRCTYIMITEAVSCTIYQLISDNTRVWMLLVGWHAAESVCNNNSDIYWVHGISSHNWMRTTDNAKMFGAMSELLIANQYKYILWY